MALRSVIEAFRAISRKGTKFRVVFTTDSQYLVKGMTEWVHGWSARGWTRKGGSIENLELWHSAVGEAAGQRVEWRWVRGHVGHPQNEYANFLAIRAAREQTRSDGLIASGFDEWLATERTKGRMAAEPDVFPLERPFRPARALPVVTKASLTS
jgi:ribonuclease HI